MNQLIKLFLERPDKLERILLLLLKSLVIIWLLNSIIITVFPDSLDEFSKADNFTSFKFLSKFSPFKSGLYVVCFTLTWLVLWEIMSLVIVPIAAVISQYAVAIIMLPVILIVIVLWYLRHKTFKGNKESEIGQIISGKFKTKKVLAHIASFYVFYGMDLASKDNFGSKLLLLIINNEKSFFIKSRVMTYYGIVLLLFTGVFFRIQHNFSWLHIVALVFLLFLGSLVALVRDVFKGLSRKMIIDLKVELPIEIYRESIDRVIYEHDVFRSFESENLRKKLILNLDLKDEESLCDYPRKRILIYRLYTSGTLELSPALRTIERDMRENTKQIIVCNCIPDVPLKNFLEKNGMHFIYAQDEDYLHIGLNLLNPIILEWKQQDLAEEYFEQFDEIA